MKLKDQHFQREADKYDKPIPSREVILQILSDRGEPLDFASLADAFEINR